MDTKLTFIVLFIVSSQKAYCQSDRFNLRKTGVTANSVSLTFNSIPNATQYHIKLVPRHSISNEQSRFNKSSSITLTRLESNLVYNVQVQAIMNGSFTDFSSPLSVRTAPGGCSIVHHFTTPSFITLFLEEVPGATEWTVKYSERGLDDIKTVTAPNRNLTDSYYVLVLNNLKANTEYIVQARISEILHSTSFTEEESPYGSSVTIKTDKLSYFGRAVLLNKPYDASAIANTTYVSKIEEDLTNYYKILNSEYVASIHVIEFEQKTLQNTDEKNTLCHYDIKITSAEASVAFETYNSRNQGFDEMDQRYNVAGDEFYTYRNGELVGSTETGCSATDNRTWIIHSDLGSTTRQPIMQGREINVPNNMQRFSFSDAGIFDSTNGLEDKMAFFHFIPNVVYAIQHDYLVKTCISEASPLYYDRIQLADNENTPVKDRYSIVYTTGPAPMENSCDSIFAFAVDAQNFNSSRLGFDISHVSKAIHYKFTVMSSNGSAIEETSIPEEEIDHSKSLQIITSNALLMKNSTYLLDIVITTRLANGKSATSSSSTFSFLTGAPNTTNLRIIEVMKESMKIIWDKSQCASEYVIAMSNHANSYNYTASRVTEYVVVRNDTQKISYNVTIASANGFGLSSFSLSRSSIFWRFSNITNSSFTVEWDGDPTDIQYRIETWPTSTYTNTTTNSQMSFPDLEAGVVYTVNVSALIDTDVWMLLFSVDQITVPAIPTNLYQNQSLSNVTSLTVVWDDVIGAEYFDVIFKSVSSYNGYSEERRSNTSSSFAVFTNLHAGRYYDVKVRSRNSFGFSNYAVLRLETGKDIPVIEGTYNVTNNSFVLRWSSALDTQTYKVKVTDLNTSSILNYEDVNLTFMKVPDLNPGSTYFVVVSAIYLIGDSLESKPAYQRMIPSAPSHLSHIPITNEYSFGIAWNYSFGASNYEVSLTTANLQHDVVRTSRNYWKFEDVCGGARYDVSVRACNRAGCSEPTEYQLISESFSPDDVALTEVTENEVTMNWKPIKCALNYSILVYPLETTELTTKSSKATISNLSGGVTYTIHISANFQVVGKGKASTKIFTTAAANPGFFELHEVTNSSITLSWKGQENALAYKLSISQLNKVFEINQYKSTITWAKISNLQSGESYDFSLFTISDLGTQLPNYENRKNPTYINVITATNAPEELKLTMVAERKLNAKWEEVEEAYIYKLLLTTVKNRGYNFSKQYFSREAELNITDHDPQAVYFEAAVQALNLQNHSSHFSVSLRATYSIRTGVEQPYNSLFWLFFAALVAVTTAGIAFNMIILKERRQLRKHIYEVADEEKTIKNTKAEEKEDKTSRPSSLESTCEPDDLVETCFNSEETTDQQNLEPIFEENEELNETTQTNEDNSIITVSTTTDEHVPDSVAAINDLEENAATFGNEDEDHEADGSLAGNMEDLDEMIQTLQRHAK